MKNLLSEKEVFIEELGEKALIEIFSKTQEAIEKNWESLYFSDNNDTFASMQIGNYIAVLDTHGEVKILSDNEAEVYTNKDVIDIVRILNEDKLNNYIINNNNWFAVSFGVITKRESNGEIHSKTIDDLVFEANPKNLEELEKSLIEYATTLYKCFAK